MTVWKDYSVMQLNTYHLVSDWFSKTAVNLFRTWPVGYELIMTGNYWTGNRAFSFKEDLVYCYKKKNWLESFFRYRPVMYSPRKNSTGF